tara:strand:+ start:267 stop:1310 length:1044 start_codon:yes stop_codon:yes gene_type:complete
MIVTRTLQRPEPFSEITYREHLRIGAVAREHVGFCKTAVIDPCKEGFRLRTGYSDENRPPKLKEVEVPIGDITFEVSVKPTTKRPTYAKLLDTYGNFLLVLEEQYHRGIRRDGIVTIAGTPHITVDEVVEEYQRRAVQILRRGIEVTIGIPDNVQREVPNTFVVPLIDYTSLPPDTGRIYVDALDFHAAVSKNPVKAFKDAVIARGREQTLPDQTRLYFVQLDREGLCLQLEVVPKKSTKYKDALNGLFGEKGAKGLLKSTGVVTVAHKRLDSVGLIRLDAKDKGKREERYGKLGVIDKGDRRFVSLPGLRGLLDELVAENTTVELARATPEIYLADPEAYLKTLGA